MRYVPKVFASTLRNSQTRRKQWVSMATITITVRVSETTATKLDAIAADLTRRAGGGVADVKVTRGEVTRAAIETGAESILAELNRQK